MLALAENHIWKTEFRKAQQIWCREGVKEHLDRSTKCREANEETEDFLIDWAAIEKVSRLQ